MVKITPDHINQLITIESSVKYNAPPEVGKPPFTVISCQSPILLSAPHGARTYRNNSHEKWHEEDEYTASIALLLGELCETSVIATVAKNELYDPNYHRKGNAYKGKLRELIVENNISYVLDLHGAALHSLALSPNQTIDLGYRGDDRRKRSMDECHIQKFEKLLSVENASCNSDSFVVERNHFAGAGTESSEPIITFTHRLNLDFRVQALQIEMKPQVRIAHRFLTASLYKSCGSYEADPHCVIHMLQALTDFIGYLMTTVRKEI